MLNDFFRSSPSSCSFLSFIQYFLAAIQRFPLTFLIFPNASLSFHLDHLAKHQDQSTREPNSSTESQNHHARANLPEKMLKARNTFMFFFRFDSKNSFILTSDRIAFVSAERSSFFSLLSSETLNERKTRKMNSRMSC
jgi:hypothetical protein